MLIELRQALVSYQDDHILLLTLAGVAAGHAAQRDGQDHAIRGNGDLQRDPEPVAAQLLRVSPRTRTAIFSRLKTTALSPQLYNAFVQNKSFERGSPKEAKQQRALSLPYLFKITYLEAYILSTLRLQGYPHP